MSDGPIAGRGASADGAEHDAWLREALRHAPDAEVAPPLSLRDAILAEARAATRVRPTPRRAPASPSLVGRLLEFWSWLARPQIAAGFASVMAATLVGMLWWDRPMDEAMVPAPEAPPAVAARSDAARGLPAAAPSQAPVPAVSSTSPPSEKTTRPPASLGAAATLREERARRDEPAPGKTAAPRPTESAAAKARQPVDASDDERKQGLARLDDRAAEAAKSAPPPAPVAPSPFPARSSVPEDSASPRPAPAATPPTASPVPQAPARPRPQPQPQPQPQTAAGPRAEPFALAKKAEPADKDVQTAPPAGAAAPALRDAAPPASTRPAPAADALTTGRLAASRNQVEAEPRQRAAAGFATTTRPMAPLLAALANEGTRWSRPTARGDSIGVDAAAQAWLAQVQAAASGWQPAADAARRRADGREAEAASATFRLDRDGRPGAVVRIDDDGVFFDPASGSPWFAPLPPEAVARLRASLPGVR